MGTSKKATPGLPASSRMQMPTGGGNLSGVKKGKAGATSNKMMSVTKGKGMAKKSTYKS